MPELPDIELYLQALKSRVHGQALTAVDLHQAFFLRTASPPVTALIDREVTALRRVGKRISIGFDNDHWLVFHLMSQVACTGRCDRRNRPAARSPHLRLPVVRCL